MENTEFRLSESKFFLNLMKQNERTSPDFDYILDAYISSSRSVLWIMKSEYSHNSEWKEWYDKKGCNDDIKKLLSGIVDMRNRSQKQRPLKVNEFLTIGDDKEYSDVNEIFRSLIGKKISLSIEQNDENKGYSFTKNGKETCITGTLRKSRTVEEFKNRDILDICEEYDLWLTDIVNECVKKFG